MITLASSEQHERNGVTYVRVARQRGRSQRELTSRPKYDGDVSDPIAPERELAAGVLRQAAADLWNYREAKDALGSEMYSDARSWFTSDDTEWPYSFTKVCRSLGLRPEEVREAIFADERSGWVAHSGRVALATATHWAGSLASLLWFRRSSALALHQS